MSYVDEFIKTYPTLNEAERVVFKHLRLDESSLGRVMKHVNNTAGCFGVISAFLTDGADKLGDKENAARALQLANAVRAKGFGYVWLEGYWVANKGTPEESQVKEYSIFVPGDAGESDKLLELLKELAHKFKQKAFIFRAEGTKDVKVHDDGGGAFSIGTFRADKIADMYSRLAKGKHHGRPFVFEGTKVPRTMMEGLALRGAAMEHGIDF